MAIVVKQTKTGKKYILLGTGFGAYQSTKAHWFLGDMAEQKQQGQYAMVCVCDQTGEIGWFESWELKVESVDGHSVESIF